MMIKKILQSLNTFVEKISPKVYFILIGIWYIIYFVSIIGLAYIDPKYVKTLNSIIQTFIALVLVIRFNPIQKNLKCNRNDRIFILASCFFLLINDEFTNYVRTFFKDRINNIKTLF